MDFYTSITRVWNDLFIRGYRDNKRVQVKVPYKPYLFLPSQTKTQHKTLDGKFAKKMPFLSMKDANDFLRQYKDVPNFDVWGLDIFEYVYTNDIWPNDVPFDLSKIRTVSIDIEVESKDGFPHAETASQPINAITMQLRDKIISLGVVDFKAPSDVFYVKCKDETELIYKFLECWKKLDPDVITGWYIRFFDIPYLVNRITKVLGDKEAKKLSPFNMIRTREINIANNSKLEHELVGITTLDYMEVFKKFSYKDYESWSLDYIAYATLGEKKLDYKKKYGTLQNLYEQNPQLFMEYNIHDTKLVSRLEGKMKFLEMIFEVSYMCKTNYIDVFKQTRMWDALIHNHLSKKSIIVPGRTSNRKNEKFRGAFVKDTKVGMHDWVVSYDLASLYPHLIMEYNIGPDTLNDSLYREFTVSDVLNRKIENSVQDHTMAANGHFFNKKNVSFLSELMEELYSWRSVAKKKMLDANKKYEATKDDKYESLAAGFKNKQAAIKVLLNSAFGTMGNEGFRYFDVRIAEAITISGQLAINWIINHINEYMNKALKTDDVDYIIASDTDSIYISFGGFVNPKDTKEETLEKLRTILDDHVAVYIKKCFFELHEIMGTYSPKMDMKQEVIADRAIWTGKKRYVLNMLYNEGVMYSTPELKTVGLETNRSSTPEISRKKLENSLKIIMRKNEAFLQNYVRLVKDKFMSLPFNEISSPRGVSRLENYKNSQTIYSKGTPIQVRAALLYNHLIKENQLEKKYPFIQSGEKIKFCYLKTPNTLHENVIGAIDNLPDEFKLNEYLDREMQFKKTFKEPLDSILNTFGWSSERQITLDSFYE